MYTPSKKYVDGKLSYFDNCDPDKWKFGLRPLEINDDAMYIADLGNRFKVIDVYVEHPKVNPLLADIKGICDNTDNDVGVLYNDDALVSVPLEDPYVQSLDDPNVEPVNDAVISSHCVEKAISSHCAERKCATMVDNLTACSSNGGAVRGSSFVENDAGFVENDDIGANRGGLADNEAEDSQKVHLGELQQYIRKVALREYMLLISNPKMKLFTFQDKVKQDIIIDITKSQAFYKARVKANIKAAGDVAEQYIWLWDYCVEIVLYGGQLLTAVERDLNRQMYHTAYAVIETENRYSWS
ncbi:hypothetical protein FEM48_Zijuj05G0105000 [Ziziphus jujuba var. spinosa]|uniref:Uncharacterized protein n=1 Tax=Ziziphus jujuba var. spinosa TaxID=714518 RepID=A0A978VEF9_ZIZJJ|nr:hypothetical protein FEM48_Zijuj05G0105000 [Ziziphus jujuba var. spinosa]